MIDSPAQVVVAGRASRDPAARDRLDRHAYRGASASPIIFGSPTARSQARATIVGVGAIGIFGVARLTRWTFSQLPGDRQDPHPVRIDPAAAQGI
jgi:hypothetical protein